MRYPACAAVVAAATAIAVSVPVPAARAHGIVGDRFFPATLATDDPFVLDELALPTISTIRQGAMGDTPATRQTELRFDYAKRITSDLGLFIGQGFSTFSPRGASTQTGFGNLEVGAKYQFLVDPQHELLLSAGLSFELGGTGAQRVGAESFSAVTPGVFFAKGFGDLPETLPWLRPFAVTGLAGVTVPLRAVSNRSMIDPDTGDATLDRQHNARVLQYGFTVQYSLLYLQSNVRDVGLGPVLGCLIPLVEFAFSSPLSRGAGGGATGTINPGVIWIGRSMQIGVEAIIPINERSGRGVGAIAQLHFYIDDLFPRTLGRPLFGG